MNQIRRSSRLKNKVDHVDHRGDEPSKQNSFTNMNALTRRPNQVCDDSILLRRSTRASFKRAIEAIKVSACELTDNSSEAASDSFATSHDFSSISLSSNDEEYVKPARVFESMAHKDEKPSKNNDEKLSKYEEQIALNVKTKMDFLASLKMQK